MDLAGAGEINLIERLCRRMPTRSDVVTGVGDDCAVVRADSAGKWDYLLKSDSCIEGVHFLPGAPARLAGRKALARVLSDFAAMGGEPLWILSNLVAPPQTSLKRVEEAYAGMKALASLVGAAVVGGDVSAGNDFQIHVFGVGRVPRGRAVLRSGAKPGDEIFVTGALGGSSAGRHLSFEPRLAEGQWLARGKWASAMIDLSDGLLRDLWRILQASSAGALIMMDAIPAARALLRRVGRRRALQHALGDGEDYELLFTVPARKSARFYAAWKRRFRLPCARIGMIAPRAAGMKGVDAGGKMIKLSAAGFEHFR